MYQKGRGISQDQEQAVQWYGKAAEQVNADVKQKLEQL
jgi:TPR repeat protein